MTDDWIQQAIRDFGTELHLRDFRCNDQGVACAVVENGRQLRLEDLGTGSLFMILTVPAEPSPELFSRLLRLSHPDRSPGFALHAAYQPRNRCAVLLLRIDARDLTRPGLDRDFRHLWKCADTLEQ